MAVDVTKKPISANDVKNGTSVVFVPSVMSVRSQKFQSDYTPSIDALYSLLDTKFDDPTYYTCAT